MNMPKAMARNPAQVLTPTTLAGVWITVTLAISQPSPGCQNALLDPDAPDDQNQVDGRK